MARVSASEVAAYQPEQIDEPKGTFAHQPDMDQIDAPYDGEIDLEAAVEAGKGCTLGDVAKMCLRVAAGVVGLPIYGLMLGSTALLSACLVLPVSIIGLPFALVGACIGACIETDKHEPATVEGAILGFIIAGSPLLLADVVTYLPRAILCYTVGVISAGLTSYALYGRLEEFDEIEGGPKSRGYSALMDSLEGASFPLIQAMSQVQKD